MEADPAAHGFFNNPNRVNSFGISPKSHSKMTHQRGHSMNGSFYGKRISVQQPQFHGETTYGRFFADRDQRSPSEERAPWGSKTDEKAKAKQANGIQWAGEHHKRITFRKKKDQIADWTNVLFRS